MPEVPLRKKFVILITGSRDWDNFESIKHRIIQAIAEWLQENPEYSKIPMSEWLTVVHGGCPRGADRLADIFARNTLKCKVIVYQADWKKYGKRAGPVRNLQMVQKSNADACLAFIKDRSSGATGCRDAADKFGIATETFHYVNELEEYPLPEQENTPHKKAKGIQKTISDVS